MTSAAHIQTALAALGHYSGPIDGRYCTATARAILAYRAVTGLGRVEAEASLAAWRPEPIPVVPTSHVPEPTHRPPPTLTTRNRGAAPKRNRKK